jgi:hypothetical protein
MYWPGYHEYVCIIIPCSEPTGKITALHFPWVMIAIYATEQSKEYQVTAETKITVNGQRGAFSNLATGMDVAVFTAADPTADPTAAVTIDAKSQ